MNPRDYMLKREREKLADLLAADLGVDRDALADVTRGARVPTRAGKLWVHVDAKTFGCIFCRFDDPDIAARVLHPGEKLYPGGGQRLNPCSGKWNYHFSRVQASTALALFKQEFDRIRGS